MSKSLDASAPSGKGLTLYINNGFENHQRYHRKGAEQEIVMITEKFEQLTGNTVFVARNVSDKAELNSYVEIFKGKLQQKKYDYIMVIISSHGRHTSSHTLLALEDMSTVDLFNDILYPLKDFKDPKVLLFDAVTFENDFGVYEPPRTPEGDPINGRAAVSKYFLSVPAQEAAGSIYLPTICKVFYKGGKLIDMHRMVEEEIQRICEEKKAAILERFAPMIDLMDGYDCIIVWPKNM